MRLYGPRAEPEVVMVGDYGTKRADMSRSRSKRAVPPLNPEQLHELALRYVGKYATTRSKLGGYLQRKIRERGWSGPEEPAVDALVQRMAKSGLVDDATYALSKARSLSERGYGIGRVGQALRASGVDEEDGAEARELAEDRAADAAIRFARRRRIGPFASERADPRTREKSLAAMVRAGHGFDLARRLVDWEPGTPISPEDIAT
jgi:regulatory protein